MLLTRVVETSTAGLNSEADAVDVKLFFEKHPAPKVSKAIAQSVERIESRAKWIARDREPALEWLASKKLSA